MTPPRTLLGASSVLLFVLAHADSTPVPVVREALGRDTSPPLHLIRPPRAASQEREMPPPGPLPGRRPGVARRIEPPALADASSEEGTLETMPPPLASFEGVGNVNGVVPPDTVGDVGPSHVVEWVNKSYAVYDRRGNLLYGPVSGNVLWSGFGGRCETSNAGDPIVVYDHLADRWMLSQLAFDWPHDFHQCIAVSATPDPTGPWHRYDFFFDADKLNDYPKFGVWPDAYYLAVNQFDGPTQAWRGQGVLAFERGVMLAGGPARMIYFDLYGVNADYGAMLPSDLEGPIPPPPGSPNYFVEVDDDAWWPAQDRLSVWKFRVDWANPSLSTFGIAGNPSAFVDLTAAGLPFDADLCGYSRSCIPQPGGSRVDALSDRLMWRLQYRNFGTLETLVVNHTVDANGLDRAGVRWYEIRDPGGAPFVAAGGTHAPDADHRWMGSAAMDGAANLAIAYNVSSTVTFPSIRYAGRRPGDPPGTLPLAEATLVAGTGYQTGASRWGDYSTLVVDPTDDCTFWYFGEYHAEVGDYPWHTRFGSFRIDRCGQCPLVGRPGLSADRDPAGVRLTWTATPNAVVYDVLEGELGTLRAALGDFAASTTACAANDAAGPTVVLSEPDPPLGDGIWYLVRGTASGCRGSLDDDSPQRVASRDAGAQAAAGACP